MYHTRHDALEQLAVAKRKLNKGQWRRVRDNQAKRLDIEAEEPADNQFEAAENGIVVSRYGKHADIEGIDGTVARCHIRRGVESLVCGDQVVWRRSLDGGGGIVEAVHERRSLLSRPDYYDGLKPVAANIDRIFIVTSVLPAFSSQIIDRYLVACEDSEITPVIVLNKADLLREDLEGEAIEPALAIYANIGYRVILVSAVTGEGIEELEREMTDQVAIVVGQSGVGKSSLVNALLPSIDAHTQAVSDNSGLGQHTTTVATRYHLPTGGVLIDSPGIREFALWHLEPERVAWCYLDFRPHLGQCKFRDCKHQDDPGCAIKEAVQSGDIASLRLTNFHKIIASMDSQKPARMSPRGS